MTVHLFAAASPPPELARALAKFEEQFCYPLGPGRSFRIVHSEDYSRFFRAMGEGTCFVVERERDGTVVGVIGAALRRVVCPSGEERPMVYLGDLKIAPSVRGGRTLPRLAGAVRQWVRDRTDAAFAVVMDGTPVAPTRYTGRLGIPRFAELARIVILRVTTSGIEAEPRPAWVTTGTDGEACYARLSAGRYATFGGNPAERSEMEPLWLLEPGGQACGRLEDTRRAKRLIADDGVEMRSAHLSCFVFQHLHAGIELLRIALSYTAHRGLPALFVAVSGHQVEDILQRLRGVDVVRAPATIYGTGIEPGPLWNINTAEI